MQTLVVDDDETLRYTLRYLLEDKGLEVKEANDGQEAIEMCEACFFDLIFLDVNMPRMGGLEALKIIKEKWPRTLCLMLTAFSDVKDVVYAIKLGAHDYVEKPLTIEQLEHVIEEARNTNEITTKAVYSAPTVKFKDGQTMVGASSKMERIYNIISKLALVDTSVLIRGESGTGKELVARAIHFNSPRKKSPFIAVNAAAIPESLIESELFGYEKGAFTGATSRKPGKFQLAEGGTLFLDEIGDISLTMQVKLLRVLQDKAFTSVGGTKEQKVNVRIVAATNRNLEEMMTKGDFRSDLYYRLNVLPIELPPLRDRQDDLEELISFLIKKFNEQYNKSITGVDTQVLTFMKSHEWPGNIRELENVVEHCFVLEDGDLITKESLPQSFLTAMMQEINVSTGDVLSKEVEDAFFEECSSIDFPKEKEEFERTFLVKALKAHGGKINQTALRTRMTKVTLLRKIEKYGINPREYYNNI